MNQNSTWQNALIKYCIDFNIPINYLSDILRDSKVNPMIRGKGFEFSTLMAFQNIHLEKLSQLNVSFLRKVVSEFQRLEKSQLLLNA